MASPDLTAEYLRCILSYDPKTGAFTWHAPRPKIRVGDIAGTPGDEGYIIIKIDAKSYKAHRLAWLYMTGRWPKDQIDHENREKSDNRFDNLRERDNAGNCWNQGIRKNNTSGFKGVHWCKGKRKWQAAIGVRMKKIHLGFFDDLQKAGRAYLDAAARYHDPVP